MERLGRYSGNAQEAELGGLLRMLNSYPVVLLVLNHPLWDEKGRALGTTRKFWNACWRVMAATFTRWN